MTAFLRRLFDVAVATADPMARVPAALPSRPDGRLVVIGAGKASARMAEAVESVWGPCEGLVITRYGYGRPVAGIEIVEAAHPVPDQAGLEATGRLLALLESLGEGDTVLALISGGGSSLLIQPAGDVSLAEKQAVNEALLASGAPIDKMNVVRKHLSRVKGGQLAATAYPAAMHAMLISDVPGDDPGAIASGPTVGEQSTASDATAIIEAYGMDIPPSALAALRESSVLAPGDKRLSTVVNTIVAAPSQSLEAAADVARAEGLEVEILGDALEGEARDLAAEHARIATSIKGRKLLLSGGECTVTRRGDGVGGPNAEYALALAIALEGQAGVAALACDTDGVDGAAEVAGAVIDPTSLTRARAAGLDPDRALAGNDAHSFFAAIGDQVITGPTLTNVNDFRAILIDPDL